MATKKKAPTKKKTTKAKSKKPQSSIGQYLASLNKKPPKKKNN